MSTNVVKICVVLILFFLNAVIVASAQGLTGSEVFDANAASVVKVAAGGTVSAGVVVAAPNIIAVDPFVFKGANRAVAIVTTRRGQKFRASVLGGGSLQAPMLLEVQGLSASAVQFANKPVAIGETLFGVGHKLGGEWVFSQTSVSTVNQRVYARNNELEVFHTSGVMLGGKRGTALFNDNGGFAGLWVDSTNGAKVLPFGVAISASVIKHELQSLGRTVQYAQASVTANNQPVPPQIIRVRDTVFITKSNELERQRAALDSTQEIVNIRTAELAEMRLRLEFEQKELTRRIREFEAMRYEYERNMEHVRDSIDEVVEELNEQIADIEQRMAVTVEEEQRIEEAWSDVKKRQVTRFGLEPELGAGATYSPTADVFGLTGLASLQFTYTFGVGRAYNHSVVSRDMIGAYAALRTVGTVEFSDWQSSTTEAGAVLSFNDTWRFRIGHSIDSPQEYFYGDMSLNAGSHELPFRVVVGYLANQDTKTGVFSLGVSLGWHLGFLRF